MTSILLFQEKKEVEDVLEQQASEIQILRAYEQQLSNMSIALSKMENALRQEQEEKVKTCYSTRQLLCTVLSCVL